MAADIPWQDAKQLKESVLKVQADLQALEKQYPALAELTAKHGAQTRALLSGNRLISDAARTEIILVRAARTAYPHLFAYSIVGEGDRTPRSRRHAPNRQHT